MIQVGEALATKAEAEARANQARKLRTGVVYVRKVWYHQRQTWRVFILQRNGMTKTLGRYPDYQQAISLALTVAGQPKALEKVSND